METMEVVLILTRVQLHTMSDALKNKHHSLTLNSYKPVNKCAKAKC
jgi:hypothetical protein